MDFYFPFEAMNEERKTGFYYFLPELFGSVDVWARFAKVDKTQIIEHLESVWIDCGCLDSMLDNWLKIHYRLEHKSYDGWEAERESAFEDLEYAYKGFQRGAVDCENGKFNVYHSEGGLNDSLLNNILLSFEFDSEELGDVKEISLPYDRSCRKLVWDRLHLKDQIQPA